MRRPSPPIPSSPCAPTHQRPGRAGVTCGLRARHDAVTRCMARPTARSSQGRTSRPAQMARDAGMVMPCRTPSVAACVVATMTRSSRESASARSSQCAGSSSGNASPVARALPSLVAPPDCRGGGWPSSHTATIGNFGMRTQATRMIDDTGNLDRGTKAAAKNGELGWSPLDHHPIGVSSPCRTAPPTCDTDPSPTTTNAASLSRARPTRRSATCRVSVGALSSTTSVKAPLRSSTSAHQAPRAGSRGRTTRRKSQSSDAQPAGSRVRDASMQATP